MGLCQSSYVGRDAKCGQPISDKMSGNSKRPMRRFEVAAVNVEYRAVYRQSEIEMKHGEERRTEDRAIRPGRGQIYSLWKRLIFLE